jgi:hypothetical protein
MGPIQRYQDFYGQWSAMVVDRFRILKEFVDSENISLYVINLPEHFESRRLYKEKNYEQYLELVQSNLDNGPFLDLRYLLRSEEFYDVVHATLPGAKRVTETVIRFKKNHRDVSSELASTPCQFAPQICQQGY